MRNSYPSELSIRSNSETWIDNLDNFGQKRKTLEMDKRLSEDLPTTPSVVISGNIVTTKEPSEQTVNLSQNKMDQSEKRELSRTRELTDPPQGGASTSTHTPVIEQAKTDSHSQQCLTKPSKDSKTTQSTVTDNVQMSKSVAEETQTKTVTYGVESSGTEALPSLCPQTLIKQCPENQQAYPQQMRHVNAQAPLPTEAKIIGTQPTGDLHTKRFQADVRHGNEKETSCEEKTDNVIKQSTKLQDHISSSSHIKPSADGQCTIDAAGASAVLDIASEQTTTKTTMAETCKQEEKQTSVHPGPKTVDSDLCQEAPSDHEKTSQTCSRKRDPVSHDPHENHPGVSRTETPGTLTKTCSPNSLPHNLGTQAGARVEYKSVAVSPIVPPGTLSTFTFQTQVGKRASSSPQGSPKGPPGKKIARTVDTMAKAGSFELAPPQQEVGSEAGIRVECKSVAISPIVPTDGTPLFTFQAGKGELWSTAVKDQHTGKDPRSIDMLSKTPSFEVTPPQQDIGTQAGTRVECISVANSPIIPPEGTSSFSFQDDKRREVLSSSKKSSSGGDQTRGKENRTLDALAKTSSFELTPPQQDFGSQAGTRVECRSVAVSPFIPPDGTSSFSFQEDKSKNHSSLDRSSADEDKSKKKEARTCDMLPKTGSFELTPPQQDATSQAGNRVECISVANSPIVFPSDGSVSFTFQSNKGSQQATPEKCSSAEDQTRGMEAKAEGTRSKNCCHEFPPPQKDMETQADSKVECKSVALSPFVLSDGPSTFTFQAKTTESKCQEQSKPTGVRTMDTISKTCLFELTPPQQDEATQVDTRVECKSVAVSPIIPPDGSTTFTFQKEKSLQGSPSRKETFTNQTRATDTFSKTYSFELTPPQQDEGTQVDTRVECKSVAVSPIIPPDGSTAFTFQAEKKQHGSPSLETQVSKNAAVSKGTSFGDGLTKTCLVELTPTHQHVGTETRVECTSVAVSPIIPPDGTSSFSFQADIKKQSLSPKSTSSRGRDAHPLNSLSKTCSLEVTPPQQDVGTQAGSRVECKSAAVSPIIPPGESSSFPFSADSAPQESSSQISFSVPESDRREARNLESLPKDVSFEITPPQQDVGVQVDTLVQCVHMAVSPIVPPDGCTSFHFQSEAGGQGQLLTSADPKLAASRKDAELQVSIYAETRSVATGPMTPLGKSPRTSYPEVHVKGTKGEPSEPVREVSWDEKGMTWEVYGASMEVEVLGMAIQKHLEKQIEEHGRQKVMTPQNTRASSIRGAPVKGDPKRPPSIFRAMLHNMRRPRCCSRAGPAPE